MRARALLLLEVVLGLALLAGVGAGLLTLEMHALRQHRRAQERAALLRQVEDLLWTWSTQRVAVTLPATGSFTERLRWRREVQPIRLAPEVFPTQVTLVVSAVEPGEPVRELYRLDWLVPPHRAGGAGR